MSFTKPSGWRHTILCLYRGEPPGSYFALQTLLAEEVNHINDTGLPGPLCSSTGSAREPNVQSTSSRIHFSAPTRPWLPTRSLKQLTPLQWAPELHRSVSHRYITQSGFDGGVVDRTDNGTTWKRPGQKNCCWLLYRHTGHRFSQPDCRTFGVDGKCKISLDLRLTLPVMPARNAKFRFRSDRTVQQR